MRHPLLVLSLVFTVALSLTLSQTVQALPEYTTRYGQSCQLCHISPQGGGLRNTYGRQMFGYLELPSHSASYADLDDIRASLGNKLHLGFDFRSFYYSQRSMEFTPEANSFVTMQGDLYLTFTPSDAISVSIDKGLYGGFEAVARIRTAPKKPHLIVGRFMPSFGWRFDDHRAFTRRFTGFGGTTGGAGVEDGLEIGLVEENFEISGALTNGPASGFVDTDQGKAATFRTAFRHQFGRLKLTTGASYRYEELGDPGIALTRMGGLFWGAHLGNFTYLGELDRIVTSSTAQVHSHRLLWTMRKGWILQAMYDFHDPNLELSDGMDWRARAALRYIPYGYISVEPGVSLEHENGNETVMGDIMLHLWF